MYEPVQFGAEVGVEFAAPVFVAVPLSPYAVGVVKAYPVAPQLDVRDLKFAARLAS